MNQNDKLLCIYHASCTDGFAAAWAVRHALGEDNVEFVAERYGSPPPDVAGRDVIIVDFSYKKAVIHEMAARASTLVILDHHKSAAEDLAALPPLLAGFYAPAAMLEWQRQCNAPTSVHALFDMTRSGAGLAWDYFHLGQPRPWLIDLVETRDLWRQNDPRWHEARLAHAYVNSYPFSFATWDKIMSLATTAAGQQEIIKSGEAILRQHDKDVAEVIAVSRRRITIGGYDVPVANAPYMMSSDAGNAMARGEPFAATYLDTAQGRAFSLRSTDDGLDVSAIAKSHGGGGHRNAAGFFVPRASGSELLR